MTATSQTSTSAAPAPRHTFLEAGRGHYDAATQLAKHAKLAGPADHLAGLAAECAAKAMLIDYFGSVQDNGPLSRPYSQSMRSQAQAAATSNRQLKKAVENSQHGHMPGVWEHLVKLADGRRGSLIIGCLPQKNPFAGDPDTWDVDHRYVDSQQISKQRVTRHLEAARTLIAAYYLAQ